MGMHTIPVVYDPTTRRISLDNTRDTYGGATTDVNSVNISVTGIEPEGTNFIARVDFAVPVKTNNHTIIHPFILLEEDNGIWTGIIPNAILAATEGTRGKMPFQLVLANDSQVINSRNSIIMEVLHAIDADTDSETLPYEVPEWEPSVDRVYDGGDVLTIDITYDPSTRLLEFADDESRYGGATIDTLSVRIDITGVPDITGTDARLDFAVPIRAENVAIKPFVVLEKIGNAWCAMIPQAVLMAAKDLKKLPFQLVIRHGDILINSRNTIILEITRAINAMESVFSNYVPYVMYRNDTWEWISDFTYNTGSIVVYNGEMYTSLVDDNKGYIPNQNSDKWFLLTGVENVVLDDIQGTRVGSEITFTSAQVFTAAGFASTPESLDEQDRAPIITWPEE